MIDRRRKYDWAIVQAFYDAGHSFDQCMERFGFSTGAWHKAKLRADLRVRPRSRPIAVILEQPKNRTHIKLRLIREGLLEKRCSRCAISDWRDKPLSVQLDHINGMNNDYRLVNLRMLCPNCHSLTTTYGNRKRN